MKIEALRFLCCPDCGNDLRVEDSVRAPGGGIVTGTLSCVAGCGLYPVKQGVPRLLPELNQANHSRGEDQADTLRSFSAQWELYEYGSTTWGTTVSDRIQVALHELDWSEPDLEGKVILDAGCGNGTLSQALADLGATVVAIDLSESVFRAERECASDRVHFAQGNLFFPPLKRRVFDAIYSCGVFHHTPDTRRCFDALVPMLRRDPQSRFFVWLYARRSLLFNSTVEHLMKLTRRMPSWMLVPLCLGLSPLVEVGSRLTTALGLTDYAPRSLRDRSIQLHDLLSPSFVRYHSFSEARSWAIEKEFREIEETTYQAKDSRENGAGSVLSRYLTVCRPGFGMLCRGVGEAVEADARSLQGTGRLRQRRQATALRRSCGRQIEKTLES